MGWVIGIALIFAGGGWAAISKAIDHVLILFGIVVLLLALCMIFPVEIPHN